MFTEIRELLTLALMINVDGKFIPILVLIHSLHPIARIRVAVLVTSNLSKIFEYCMLVSSEIHATYFK